MLSGRLICPKCHNLGMSNYLYYESNICDGQELWIFYNSETKRDNWKCWALLEVCGCTVHKWYDPCNCCFNPCKYTPTVVTEVNGVEVSREKDCFCGMCCCFLFFLVCYLIYIFYFTIFFWYDLYYHFCKTSKEIKTVCTGNGEQLVENSYNWAENDNVYTENYWCNNYPNLFNCKKCNYHGKSFKEFIDNNQTSDNPVNIVNTQTDITNAGINN